MEIKEIVKLNKAFNRRLKFNKDVLHPFVAEQAKTAEEADALCISVMTLIDAQFDDLKAKVTVKEVTENIPWSDKVGAGVKEAYIQLMKLMEDMTVEDADAQLSGLSKQIQEAKRSDWSTKEMKDLNFDFLPPKPESEDGINRQKALADKQKKEQTNE